VEIKDGESITLEEVVDFLEKEGLAKYKWPERIETIDALPRTPTGKVLKYVLREDILKKMQSD
jgi:non-ribosomal peptide synthetase component E (peptide arylation enzyme)